MPSAPCVFCVGGGVFEETSAGGRGCVECACEKVYIA